MNRAFVFCASGLLVLGCSDSTSSESREPATVRDSLGVTIVENHTPRQDGAISAEYDVLCTARGPAGDPRVDGIHTILPIGGDRVALLSTTQSLLLLCEEGRLRAAYGGEGDGPAEFRYIRGAVRARGDSVAVLGPDRIVVFDLEDGGYREVRPDGIGRAPLAWMESTGDRVALIRSSRDSLSEGSERARFVNVDLLDDRFEAEATIVDVPWNTSLGTSGALNRLWPIRPRTFPLGSHYYSALDDSLGIVRYDPEGIDRILRSPLAKIPITPELIEFAVRESLVSLRSANTLNKELEALLEAQMRDGMPDFAPEVMRTLVSSSGELWVQVPQQDPRTDPDLWRVFDSEGLWLFELELPNGFRLRAVRDDDLFGNHYDDFGVTEVRRYRLVR